MNELTYRSGISFPSFLSLYVFYTCSNTYFCDHVLYSVISNFLYQTEVTYQLETSMENTKEKEQSVWKKWLKRLAMGSAVILGIVSLIVGILLILGRPNPVAMQKSLATTHMSVHAQKQALQVLDCLSSNILYVPIGIPHVVDMHLPVPGWFVLRLRHRFAIVDYSLSSHSKRLWILDSSTGKILQETEVRHGDGNGSQKKAHVDAFSNTPKSQLSSLGVILGTFPANGGLHSTWPSKHILLLEGQEKEFNSNIRRREIVMHSTTHQYSDGCLSMPLDNLDTSIRHLAYGGIIFSHYPDSTYEQKSRFLGCAKN